MNHLIIVFFEISSGNSKTVIAFSFVHLFSNLEHHHYSSGPVEDKIGARERGFKTLSRDRTGKFSP